MVITDKTILDSRKDKYITNVLPLLYEMIVGKITPDECKEQLDDLIQECNLNKNDIEQVGYVIAHKLFELI